MYSNPYHDHLNDVGNDTEVNDEANSKGLRWQETLPLQVFRVPASRARKGRTSRARYRYAHGDRSGRPGTPQLPDIKSGEELGSSTYQPSADEPRMSQKYVESPSARSSNSSLQRKLDCATFITAPFEESKMRRGSFRLPLIFPTPYLEREKAGKKRTFDKTHTDGNQMDVEVLSPDMTVAQQNSDHEFLQMSNDLRSSGEKESNFTLLNSGQYSSYLRKVVTKGNLFRQNTRDRNTSNHSVCNSSALVPCIPEEREITQCHVVGDLHAFASNTMRYYDNPDLSDVILLTGEHRFYAHKFALASQSDVFRDMMIVSDRCTGCPDFQKELELNETKDCQIVFPQFLRFFYCGKISFTNDTALPLLVLAAKYKVEALRTACDAFIANMIEDGDLKSALKWLKYATKYKLQDLATRCVDGAIADNLEELIESTNWQSLDPECVESIMQSSWLLVPDEFFLFEAIQRWFMNRRKSASDDEIGEDLRKILPNVRFSQMQGTQLLAVEESPVGLNYRSIMRSYLGDAYRYQILAKQCDDFHDPQYLPRDYTDKQWCVTITFHPTRNKRSSPSINYGNGRWEIQPRRYYDTVNVVIILKKPLQNDVKVCISILIYKRNGDVLMRLRRKPCVLRPVDMSPRSTILGGRNSVSEMPGNTKRSNSSLDCAMTGTTSPVGTGKHFHPFQNHPHRTPHGPVNRLHGPHNGQEYYAIDNIVSDADFQMALSHSGSSGIKFGVIIRTWSFDA